MNKALIVFAVMVLFGYGDAVAESSHRPHGTIIVYYFHRTARCPPCTLLEKLTREAVEIGFAQELENGSISMKAINVDEEDNQRFAEDYALSTQSVVLSQIDDGEEKRWKKLDRIWDLWGDQEQLWAYLQEEIQQYLEEAQQ